MAKPAWACFLSAIVLTFICAGIYAFIEHRGVAQATLSIEHSGAAQAPLSEVETVIGVDANPAGNSGTSLGTINGCISVSSTGGPFYIDLIVQDVTNLKSFDGTFRFDGTILEVTGVDVVGPVGSRYFLATASGSDIPLESHPSTLPNHTGSFQVNAVDHANAPESGEGILARLQITPRGPTGTSKANFDWRPDGYPISGVWLFDQAGNAIGDLDEDDYFDGVALSAQIAVDEPCPGECLPDVDNDSDGFDDDLECYLPTDQLDACPNSPSHDAWPLDMNMDRLINLGGDVSNYIGRMGATAGPPPSSNWMKRLDLNADGLLNLGGDVSKYVGHIGQTCS